MNWTLRAYLVCLLISVTLFPVWGTSLAAYLSGNAMQILALLFAAVNLHSLQVTLPQETPLRRAWGLTTLGMFVWVIAQCLDWYCEVVLEQIPYGTVSDFFWVIGHIFLIAGSILIVRHSQLPSFHWKNPYYFVPCLFFTAFYVLIFTRILWPQLIDTEQPGVARFLDFFYPTSDVFFGLLFGFLVAVPRMRRAGLLFAIGFTVLVCADLVLGLTTDLESPIYLYSDVVYTSAYFLIALGGGAGASGAKTISVAPATVG